MIHFSFCCLVYRGVEMNCSDKTVGSGLFRLFSKLDDKLKMKKEKKQKLKPSLTWQ